MVDQGKADEEGKEMQATTKKQADSFSEFMAKNISLVRRIANLNTKRNKDGRVVIAKDDPWRKETEWDEFYEELKRK